MGKVLLWLPCLCPLCLLSLLWNVLSPDLCDSCAVLRWNSFFSGIVVFRVNSLSIANRYPSSALSVDGHSKSRLPSPTIHHNWGSKAVTIWQVDDKDRISTVFCPVMPWSASSASWPRSDAQRPDCGAKIGPEESTSVLLHANGFVRVPVDIATSDSEPVLVAVASVFWWYSECCTNKETSKRNCSIRNVKPV